MKLQMGDEGVVHLPGRGEEWYSLSVGTISREGQDGKWFQVRHAWRQRLAGLLLMTK